MQIKTETGSRLCIAPPCEYSEDFETEESLDLQTTDCEENDTFQVNRSVGSNLLFIKDESPARAFGNTLSFLLESNLGQNSLASCCFQSHARKREQKDIQGILQFRSKAYFLKHLALQSNSWHSDSHLAGFN